MQCKAASLLLCAMDDHSSAGIYSFPNFEETLTESKNYGHIL